MCVCGASTFTETKSKLKEGLPQECQVACLCALTKFHEISDSIQRGDINIEQLHIIKLNQEQMKRLCDADKQTDLTFSTVQQRLEEFQMFERNKGHLFYLCSQLHGDIQGNYNSVAN